MKAAAAMKACSANVSFENGIGPDPNINTVAAGPDASACAARCFADAGSRGEREPSDWKIGADAADLQRMLIDGWADDRLGLKPAGKKPDPATVNGKPDFLTTPVNSAYNFVI